MPNDAAKVFGFTIAGRVNNSRFFITDFLELHHALLVII